MKNRWMIYVLYDRRGIVDEYVLYLLKSVRTVFDRILVVSQGKLDISEKEKIRRVSDDVFERENEGFDAGAIRDVIVNYIGRQEMRKCSELVLMNDSVYGPFFPLEKCFCAMQNYDFWGMTKNLGSEKVPVHLQSYFLVVGFNILQDEAFFQYWNNMPLCKTFPEVLKKYEMTFTSYFESLGYSWNSYVDFPMFQEYGTRNTIWPYYHLLNEAIRYECFPFIKRKPFSFSDDIGLDRFSRHSFFKALNYVDSNLDYDVDLIYSNLLRTYSMQDLFYNCKLHYSISPKNECTTKTKITVLVKNFPKLFERQLTDWYFSQFSTTEYRFISAESWNKVSFENIHSDYVLALDGSLLCNEEMNYASRESVFFSLTDNLIFNENYLQQMSLLFKKQARIGMLIPRISYMATSLFKAEILNNGFKSMLEHYAQSCFQGIPLASDTEYHLYGTSFLVKTSFLCSFSAKMNLNETDISDGLFVQLLILFLQEQGFFTALIENSEWALIEDENENYCYEKIKKIVKMDDEPTDFSFIQRKLLDWTRKIKVHDFCEGHSGVYVYGAGQIAEKIIPYIDNIEGIIVTTKTNNPEMLSGIKVSEFDKTDFSKVKRLVIATTKEYQSEIEKMIIEKGIEKYILL